MQINLLPILNTKKIYHCIYENRADAVQFHVYIAQH